MNIDPSRDNLRDLLHHCMAERQIGVAALARDIGVDSAMLSRFLRDYKMVPEAGFVAAVRAFLNTQ
jgi:hypothetical protein